MSRPSRPRRIADLVTVNRSRALRAGRCTTAATRSPGTGRGAGWNQSWREPLRDALDWLRDELAPHFEWEAGALLGDPWAARDGYIDLILDRSDESVDAFFARHAIRPLAQSELERALRLLEMQRHAMLMYTSCGWFFDELSGIETTQVIQYAARTVQLYERLFSQSIEPAFLEYAY